jgi:citrate synthase
VSDEKDREIFEYLDKILEEVLTIKRIGEIFFMATTNTLATILQQINAQTTIEQGINTLIQSLVANQNNPAQLQAIVAALGSNTTLLNQALLTGTPQASTTLTITPSPVSLASVGATQQLKVVDPTGADVTATATYSSSDATKATVSASGLVTEVAAGSAVISVASGVNAGTVAVTTA